MADSRSAKFGNLDLNKNSYGAIKNIKPSNLDKYTKIPGKSNERK